MSSSSEGADERLKVLLVEDSLVDAHLIIAILDSEALYQVTLAQDGMRGTLLATEQQWDLIITDLNLPGDSGLDLIRVAKGHQPETPILTTTGYTAPKYVQSALREGADDVLMKPVEREELLRKLLYLLGTNRAQAGSRRSRTVLAVSAEPGDVEVGCGGILVGHREHKQQVVMLVLSEGADEAAVEAARKAGAQLDATVIVHPVEPAADETAGVDPIAKAIADFSPDTLYVPSLHDRDDHRSTVHRAGLVASGSVPNLYCYQTVSTTTDFRPTLFVGVDDFLDGKVELVSAYEGVVEESPAYSPELIRSTARYWGRFDDFENVEPLEVVRSEV